MTADAKVGLLLGLFFIVVIAFLINGLPNFLQKETPEQGATTALVVPSGPDLVIDRRISETARQLSPGIPLRVTEPPQDVIVLNQTLPQTQMPFPVAVETPVPQPQAPQFVEEHVQQAVAEPLPVPASQAPVAAANTKAHVVQKGETLAVIAQKYYGSDAGNRRAVIQKLYEANKDVLSSPDKVVVGNKLTIPSMPKSPQKEQPKSEGLLKKFTNIFEKSAEQPKALRPVSAPTSAVTPAATLKKIKTKEYVVQPGDTIWKIAEKTMGDGRQFDKIVQLNKDRLKNADDVVVGMKLVVPAH